MKSAAKTSAEKPKEADVRVRAAQRGAAFASGTSEAILALQKSAGNRAVTELLGRSSGRPLDPATRKEMETKFGVDFKDVRVHYSPEASASAELLGAKAWTSGRHVAFGDGMFSPGTRKGKTLLAHELAHVVQQRRGGTAPDTFRTSSPAERDAARAASQVTSAGPVTVGAATGMGVARDEAELPLWKKRLNPIYQGALSLLPKAAADKLREANATAKEFVQKAHVSDEDLNKGVKAAEPIVQQVEQGLDLYKRSQGDSPKPDAAPQAQQAPQPDAGASQAPKPAGDAPAGSVDEEAKAVRRARLEGLQNRIAGIDAQLNGPGGKLLRDEYADELRVERARMAYELEALQPVSPERAEEILHPGDIQRRKQQAYANYVNLPKGLREDIDKKFGGQAPEKPAVFWNGDAPRSPALREHIERIGRRADEENLSIKAATQKVQREGPTPPPVAYSADPVKRRQEMNKTLMAAGLKPLPDPNRKLTDWEKAEIQSPPGGKRNPRNWRTVHNPENGDIVGYERENSGYYERRNTKGEITHVRENPMTEDETFLTRPDRALTPFERRHVFIEKNGNRNPESYAPVYNKNTGRIVGYKQKSVGITKTFNTEGVMVDESELGVEPSAVQLDDLIGVAAIGKAGVKFIIRKAGEKIIVGEGIKEGASLLLPRLRNRAVGALSGAIIGTENALPAVRGGARVWGEQATSWVAPMTELKQAGRQGVEELGEAGAAELKQAGRQGVEDLGEAGAGDLKQAGGEGIKELEEAGGKEAAGGKVTAGTAAEEASHAPAQFSPAPADVGNKAYSARVARTVENAMRANARNTVGAGGEAAAQASADSTVMDLNAVSPNFPQLDTVSRETVASVKAFSVDKPLGRSAMRRYDKELRALRTAVEPGVPTKLGQAADVLAANRGQLQAAGAWPKGLAKNATPEQIAKFVNQRGVLAIPADHVEEVRKFVAAKARANPAAYGLTDGPGLEKGIERLTARVQSLGLTSEQIMNINKRVLGIP